ncbi:DUF317 domain-containing protein [Streptomyces sp. NPDC056831]|uniref:DUF317 domain-containing protein n=1 Tax=Streptomyces sp. NPDC056831 TaxID=3345954 RepID=UPI0036A591BA
MTPPSVDAHVRLDLHPTHSTAVTATLSGSQSHIPHVGLEAADWTVVAENTLVLARIDHEEPYWAKDAAQQLIAGSITVDITPRLQEAIDEEWTWVDYPMPWCTPAEIREISNDAQKIYDDIRTGRLLIYAHAEDGHTTVAVGTYLTGGKSVYLHGENHLRQIADTFQSPAQALAVFQNVHGDHMRPGPAPMTDTERAAAEARTSLAAPAATAEPSRPGPEAVPTYAADPGDHNALLNTFLDAHGDWQKWRTWSDETTHAIHEDQTLRIELVHDAPARETAWTVAAYDTPVSDRAWILTAASATPAPVLQALLDHLSYGDGWDPADTTTVDEKTVTTATQPLSDAGWTHTVDGRWIRWTSPNADAGIQFDAFAAQHPNRTLSTWTIWAGPSLDHPTWTLTASPHTPSLLLADLTENLAQGTGTRQPLPPTRKHKAALGTTPPATSAATASRPIHLAR